MLEFEDYMERIRQRAQADSNVRLPMPEKIELAK